MRRRGLTLSLALLAAALVAACGTLNPFPTTPRAAPAPAAPIAGTPVPAAGASRAAAATAPATPRVAICYNTMATSLAEVQTQAQQECAAGTVAEPASTDWYLQNCPVLLPARATFVCTPKR